MRPPFIRKEKEQARLKAEETARRQNLLKTMGFVWVDITSSYEYDADIYIDKETIENATKDWHAPLPEQKHVTRWRAGTCTICGEWSTYISQDHAHRHGYKNADEMAHAGVMHWTE